MNEYEARTRDLEIRALLKERLRDVLLSSILIESGNGQGDVLVYLKAKEGVPDHRATETETSLRDQLLHMERLVNALRRSLERVIEERDCLREELKIERARV